MNNDELDALIDYVINQIKADMLDEDYTAIAEMLRFVPIKNLQAFLSEVV